MEQYSISELADWLEAQSDALLAKSVAFPETKVQAVVDYLKVLKHPAAAYLDTLQGHYDRHESDHKLNLLADKAPLAELEDRVMVNHVDGSITEDHINFTYNHEPVFEGGYAAKKDLNIIKFGLEVIGAVATTGHIETESSVLSPDAMVTLIVAAHSFAKWQG
ncbi:hypothetical protein [Lacticaseibacillus manihotivorans]|jgi:hypothetical protein|uniref:Uncharacterized protein n=2 Tax=Lacticaseibacillus manihotivorans TaxID=88233 RepID=A0A0R1QS13_9LACO|nr:hypothetical protein [Lacticaseibacillus manihotivorans]KRL47568.1 hypothetical protein FD01_GL000231 [Lacticaseibacillus manihotivorans DSM 13343 = JCM 12514]QFQ92378.1 hypothetical protein LM010_13565 [Lacticaseibacillus manihotivorans]